MGKFLKMQYDNTLKLLSTDRNKSVKCIITSIDICQTLPSPTDATSNNTADTENNFSQQHT